MPQPFFDHDITGAVNGVNTVFTTTFPYQTNSLVVFVNGQAQGRYPEFCDGYRELDPLAGTFEIPEPPLNLQEEDKIQALYMDTTPPLPEEEVCQIKGTLVELVELEGSLQATGDLLGAISADLPLEGLLQDLDDFQGVLEVDLLLSGTLSEVCE